MKQPKPKQAKKRKIPQTKSRVAKRRDTLIKKKQNHQEYGTSKLEEKFASEFLDKIGIDYIYQYKAEDIGRYFDFCIPSQRILIETDGTYYHGKGLTFEEMNPMQKKNKIVDGIKDKWAITHGFVILRIWEDDIHNNPKQVMDMLKSRMVSQKSQILLEEKKNKRHVNKLVINKDGKEKSTNRGRKEGDSNAPSKQ